MEKIQLNFKIQEQSDFPQEKDADQISHIRRKNKGNRILPDIKN